MSVEITTINEDGPFLEDFEKPVRLMDKQPIGVGVPANVPGPMFEQVSSTEANTSLTDGVISEKTAKELTDAGEGFTRPEIVDGKLNELVGFKEKDEVVVEVPADALDTTEHPKEEVDLSKMNKAELVAHAESLGLDSVPDTMTKKDIIELIESK